MVQSMLYPDYPTAGMHVFRPALGVHPPSQVKTWPVRTSWSVSYERVFAKSALHADADGPLERCRVYAERVSWNAHKKWGLAMEQCLEARDEVGSERNEDAEDKGP